MKKTIVLFALIIITGTAFSQSLSSLKTDFHQELSTQLKSAETQAMAMAKDTSKKNEDKLKNVESILKNLEVAKTSHQSIKKSTPVKQKATTQKSHESIEKHHLLATKYATSLKEELSKQKPDSATVQTYTKKLTHELSSLNLEHQSLKTILK